MILFSEIVQYLQIPSIGLLGFIFTLSAGISFFIGINYTNDFLFKFYFNLLPSNTEINFNSDVSIVFVYINLIPVFILYLMEKSGSKIQNEIEKEEFKNE